MKIYERRALADTDHDEVFSRKDRIITEGRTYIRFDGLEKVAKAATAISP